MSDERQYQEDLRRLGDLVAKALAEGELPDDLRLGNQKVDPAQLSDLLDLAQSVARGDKGAIQAAAERDPLLLGLNREPPALGETKSPSAALDEARRRVDERLLRQQAEHRIRAGKSREAAIAILRDKGQGTALPTNLDGILRSERVLVERFEAEADFDGRLELRHGVPTIFVNAGSNVDPGRARFTLAHEIGHYFLHRTALKAGCRFDDGHIDPSLDVADEFEAEANLFASECLFPTAIMAREYKDRIVTLGLLRDLAERATASLQASAIRLAQESADCFCFLFIADGVVKWTAPSEDWRYRKLPSSSFRGRPLPRRSTAAQIPDDFEDLHSDIGAWAPAQSDRELALYESALDTPFGRMVLVGVGEADDESDDAR